MEAQQLVEKVAFYQEKSDILVRGVEALLHFLKAFALDVKEIRSDHFKETVDELSQRFTSEEKPKRVELHFEHQKSKLLSFIESQHGYLDDREKELRDIIDLLSKAMANLDVGNREFYDRVHDQSEKMEQITRLDDIKKIKSALKQEVDQMREIVEIKKDQDRRQVKNLAGQVDILRQELEKARAKSMTDGLTGINNRESFDDTLMERIERCKIMNNTFCMLLLDLDDFKAINDTYGHLIGDRVLVAFAQKCRNTIRGDDFMARYGGEEFAILLMGTNMRNALKKARQICDTIASTRYATSGDQKDDYFSVTVSIGVSAYKKGDTPETLISRVDKALYTAKKRGKNCAVSKS